MNDRESVYLPDNWCKHRRKITIKDDVGRVIAESAWLDDDEYDDVMWALGKFSSPLTNLHMVIES